MIAIRQDPQATVQTIGAGAGPVLSGQAWCAPGPESAE